MYFEKKHLKTALFENFSLKTIKRLFPKSLFLGLVLAVIYFSAFYLFKDFLVLDEIKAKLTGLISVNLEKLILVGLYIIIFNSLLEEYFWRSFLFKEFKKVVHPFLAYSLPAIAFSFHHVMFYYNWFSLPFFIAVTFGLVAYSLIMNKVFDYSKDLFTCWLVHALVDIVQISIAFIVFAD
jgi:membrane protease YdiL (CAAX protease family)